MSFTELLDVDGPLAAAFLLVIAALALGVIAVTPRRLTIARNCFLASCGIFAGIAIMWGITTDYSFWHRTLIVGAFGAFAAIAAVESIRFITREQKESHPAATESIRPFAQCDFVQQTITVPLDGKIYLLQINAIPASAGGGGIGIFSGTPGEKFNFPVLPSQLVYKCQITNYASVPLFKMSIALRFTFMEAVKKDSAASTTLRSGAVTIDREWPLEIPKIDPGKDSSFAFYMINASAQYVRVLLPAKVSFMAGLDEQIKSVDLVQPTINTGMWLPPRMDMVK